MKEEVESGARAEAPARGSSKKEACEDTPKKARKPRSASKKNDAVLSGRISKSKSVTPTKKRGVNANVIANANAVMGVKEEMESSASSMMGLGDVGDRGFEVETPGGWDMEQDDELHADDEMWQSGQSYGIEDGADLGVPEEV